MRFLRPIFLIAITCHLLPLLADEDLAKDEGYTINFDDVPIVELIQFVRKISGVNFIFNHRDLSFNVPFFSGKSVSPDRVVRALIQTLRTHGLSTLEEDGYLVIHKGGQETSLTEGQEASFGSFSSLIESKPRFLVYKIQFHDGSEIEETVKRIAEDLTSKPETSPRYLSVLKSVQWIKSTNSLVCSGDEASLNNVEELLKSLDVPLKQVFIEVLVVETDARNSSEFGLQWATGGQYKGVGFGMGNFSDSKTPNPFALSFQGIDASHPPTGPSQFPLGNGFDMGVIGDIILHKGKSFLSLASLVSALQSDGDSSIVLNQKIITQDNKNSTIFVGDNIPFTGSIVQTTGVSQQTTANVEYRDVGVNLSITPKLGEGDIITLDLNEEITEAVPASRGAISPSQVSGIQTTKTNMRTYVHVPNKHFLVLSGMIRNAKGNHKVGLPCLGGIPFIGAAFSKTVKHDEKRNVIIFVRPHIIKSVDDYRQVTERQEDLYKRLSTEKAINDATALVK